METNWQQWRLAGVGSLALLLVKSQSQVATRRCADVFNQQCKTASFQAPLWQAAVTLIAQLGCLSWWLTERVVHPVQSSAPMDGVTDAFGELHTHPPVWSYMFFAIPGALEVVALTMLYIALGTLPLSSVLAVFAFGYVAYRIFTACLGQRRLQRSDYVSFALLLLAAVFIAWAQIERVLQLTAAFTPSAFTPGAFNPGARAAPNTQLLNGKQTRGETVAGNTSPSLGSDLGLGPDLGGAIGGGAGQKVLADAVQIIDGLGQPTLSNESFLLIDTILFALLLGLAAGAVYTLRLIIVEGLLQRFRFHYMQALGLEALYGLSLAVVGLTVADGVMFEDSGVTMFQLITNVSLVYSTLGFIVLHFLYLLTSYYLVSNTRIFKGVCCSLGLWTGLSSGLRETKPGPRTGPSTRLSARRKHKATSEDEVEPDLTALYPVEFIYRLPLVLLGELVLQGGTGWCQMQGLVGRSMLILVSILVAKKQSTKTTLRIQSATDIDRSTDLAAYSEILRAQRSSYLNAILSSTKAPKGTHPCPLCVAEEFEQDTRRLETRQLDTRQLDCRPHDLDAGDRAIGDRVSRMSRDFFLEATAGRGTPQLGAPRSPCIP